RAALICFNEQRLAVTDTAALLARPTLDPSSISRRFHTHLGGWTPVGHGMPASAESSMLAHLSSHGPRDMTSHQAQNARKTPLFWAFSRGRPGKNDAESGARDTPFLSLYAAGTSSSARIGTDHFRNRARRSFLLKVRGCGRGFFEGFPRGAAAP